MVAAWMSADTGVGPSIASGSHRYSGSWALLPHGADEQQQSDGRGGRPGEPTGGRVVERR